MSRASLNKETLDGSDASVEAARALVPWLTVLHHPLISRIGDECSLEALDRGEEIRISRVEPELLSPRGKNKPWPLGDPFLSRKPVFLRASSGGGIELVRPREDAVAVNVDGDVLGSRLTMTREQLAAGVVLELGKRVVLLLHLRRPRAAMVPDLQLIGESEALDELRGSIVRVADLDVPVLLLGETGSGKERVAEAIHRCSKRSGTTMLSVNMATIAPSVAASELFGHVKGAFTGAANDNPGYFVRADGGTLFMDEIGETPIEVQTMLLRVLETGVVQPLGDRNTRKVDVRLIAATDADLTDEQRFRPALFHRLAGYEIRLPPLRARRDDLGRLFAHFLKLELAAVGEASRLEITEPESSPFVPASIVARLAQLSWPGNVRQLRNAVRQMVISSRGAAALRIDASTERMLGERPPATVETPPAATERRKPSTVTEEELITALRANRWRLQPTAEQLRITRPSLYMLIDKSARLRKAKDVPSDELKRVFAETGGDLEAMAEKLEVSPRGLSLRIKDEDS